MPAIIKKERVQVRALSPDQLAAARSRPSNNEACEKQVRLVEDRGRVIALELSCSCGELTVVELEYDQAAPPRPDTGPEPGPKAETA